MKELPLLLKAEQTGEILGIGRTKVYELLASGEIESVRIGRNRLIPRKAVEEYVERLTALKAS